MPLGNVAAIINLPAMPWGIGGFLGGIVPPPDAGLGSNGQFGGASCQLVWPSRRVGGR